jgi:protein phosphatase-4 regulatory subunit 3
MIQKIDRAFRLEYLQSIFLTNDNFSDDMFIGNMNTMVYQSHSDMVNYVQNNREFMNDLFDLVRNEDTLDENKKDAIKFIIQLCNLTKQMQSSARVNLLR